MIINPELPISNESFKKIHTSIQDGFAKSQWWSADQLKELQINQLKLLIDHAMRKIPFYTKRFQDIGISSINDFTEDLWNHVPILTRKEAQVNQIQTPFIPPGHGRMAWIASSGSTGIPIRMTKTELSQQAWTANLLRDELWNRPNQKGTILYIRHGLDNASQELLHILRTTGVQQKNYGPPSSLLWDTGPLWVIDDRCSAAHHAEIIDKIKPDYIISMPSNLRLLLKHYQEYGGAPGYIKSVWTASESISNLRELCREILRCKIIDNYSCAEAGYLALQCPECNNYHVMSETVILEVVKPDGSYCLPGEVGRVLITPLYNFATPLFRYDIGDEVEVGDPCQCGRGLPVLKRIIGRTYDYLTLPNGKTQRVDTGYYPICAIPAVKELQIIQRSLELIEVLLVISKPLTKIEEKEIIELCIERFGNDFQYKITPVEYIQRTSAGKHRVFVSEIKGEI